ncbi:MAG: transporter substrate-binding domain-containing protein [Thiotrichaceae bacterium]|nr:transporter substrate-binding domain-containing protein [Thiotrichaceae bacterium]
MIDNINGSHRYNSLIKALLITLLFASPSLSMAKGQDFVILSKELPPFQYYDNKHRLTGVAVEIVREVLREVGHPEKILIYPWARAYNEAKTQKNRILFTTSRTPERIPLFKWVGPLFSTDTYLYQHRNSKLVINNLEDARQRSKLVIVPRSFAAQYKLKKANFKNLHPQTSPLQGIKMVINGHADIIALEKSSVVPLMKSNGLDPSELVRTKVKVLSTDFYIAFSKDTSDKEISRWQKAFEKVKRSKPYAQIAQRYRSQVRLLR